MTVETETGKAFCGGPAGAEAATATIVLTARELTLIRVALLQRLDNLSKRDDLKQSYDESRTLLNGKLWAAVKAIKDY